MSSVCDGTSMACINWVARQSIDYLHYQIMRYKPHYFARMHDNPSEYLMHALRTHYVIAPRGWQRQFRRAPEKLANRVYYQICLDLGGRP